MDDSLLGVIGVADTLRANSAEAVESLQRMGIEVYMMTGDNERTAQASSGGSGGFTRDGGGDAG